MIDNLLLKYATNDIQGNKFCYDANSFIHTSYTAMLSQNCPFAFTPSNIGTFQESVVIFKTSAKPMPTRGL